MVVPHEEFGIFLEHVVRDLFGDGDNYFIIPFLPCFLESYPDGLQAENLELFLGVFVFFKLFEKGFFTQFFQVARFVRVRHVPAVFGFGDQCRIVFGKVAHVFPIGRKVTVDLLWNWAFAIVAEEVLVQKLAQVDLGLIFTPAAKLLHE